MKLLVMTLLLGTTLLATTACSNDEVSLGQEFSLDIGQSASVRREELQIKFLKVVEDSRCPQGATCVWEGRVRCLVEITYRESLHSVVLTEPGLTSWPPEQAFQGYKLAYHVEPYPQAGTNIAEDEYRLHLRISRQGPDEPGG